jgi:hypothetical protein
MRTVYSCRSVQRSSPVAARCTCWYSNPEWLQSASSPAVRWLCSCTLQRFSQESLDFQERISQRSGLGDGTACLPPALHILPKPIITMQVQAPLQHSLHSVSSDCPISLDLIRLQVHRRPHTTVETAVEPLRSLQGSYERAVSQAARDEAEQVMFEAVERALRRTGERASQHTRSCAK